MIPILFDKAETEFKTNGLGRLSDAISCEVDEERNGSYELEMTYPVNGIHYADIQYGRIIYAEPAEGETPQPFEIFKITKPLNQIVTINAEHISYRLKYIPTIPFEADGVKDALVKLKNNAVCPCPFSITTDKNASGKFKVKNADSIRSYLTDGDDTITAAYGGEWYFDKFDAKLCKARGTDNGVIIRYGKNLTSLEQEENIENMVTGVYPYFTVQKDVTTTEEETDPSTSRTSTVEKTETIEETVTLPEKVLNTKVADKFPYSKVIAVDLSQNLENEEVTRNWTETKSETDSSTSRVHTTTEEKSETIKIEPTVEVLRKLAEIYIETNGLNEPEVSLKLDFVNLAKSLEYDNISELERVHLCDTVLVEFQKLGVFTKAKVIKTQYDVLNEKYIGIEIGTPKETLASYTGIAIGESEKRTNKTISNTKKDLKNDVHNVDNNLGLKITQTQDSIKSQAMEIKKLGDAQTTMQTSIEQNAESIKLTASEVKTIDGKQTTMQTSIEQNADNIALKASKGSLISEINACPEGVKISGDKINIEGNTTFTSVRDTANAASGTASSALSTANSKLSASDVGKYGTTEIDGARIKTGLISADRIEGVSINKVITGNSYRVVSEASFEGNGSTMFQSCFDSNMARYSIATDTLNNVRERLRKLEAKN